MIGAIDFNQIMSFIMTYGQFIVGLALGFGGGLALKADDTGRRQHSQDWRDSSYE